MQARYYLGLAAFVLGLAILMLGKGGFGENAHYFGVGLCALGFILIMASKRRHKTGKPSLKSGADPHRAHRAARRKNQRNSGDGRHDHDNGGDGD